MVFDINFSQKDLPLIQDPVNVIMGKLSQNILVEFKRVVEGKTDGEAHRDAAKHPVNIENLRSNELVLRQLNIVNRRNLLLLIVIVIGELFDNGMMPGGF